MFGLLKHNLEVKMSKAPHAHTILGCQMSFSVACAGQETCSSEMLGGQGADFLRWIAFWSTRGAALCMTWRHFLVAGAVL